jgi:hypothetical protein
MDERLNIDALEDLAIQLRAAAARERRPKRLSWGPRRGVVVSLAVLAVAAPALAVTQPWSPMLSRPGTDNPVKTDASPVTASAREALAVLRRPQTPEDRAKTAPLLKAVGAGNQVDGVQTASIRLLTDGVALVPAKTVRTGPFATSDDELCLTNGTSVTCGPASSVRTTGITSVEASRTTTSYTGLVPDGVARVRFTANTGTAAEAAVTSNFYSLSVPEVAPPRMIDAPDAPDGSNGPSRIPGPPTPVGGTIEWLDANGRIVGPEHPNR